MKNMRAIAVSAMVTLATGSALAEGSTSIYGLLDIYAARFKGAPGGVNAGNQNISRFESGGLTTSRFGIHGSEDLGSGLTAAFELSAFIRLDVGAVGRSDAIGTIAGDPFWSRESSLSLYSKILGRLRAGNFATPMFEQSLGASAFAASTVFAPINVLTFIGSALSGGTGWSNQLAYDSPKLGGFLLTAAASASEGQGGHNAGARAAWSEGPATVSLAWQSARKNPLTFADGVSSNNTRAWQLVGSYDFKSLKVFAHLGQIRNDGTELALQNVRYTIQGVSASVPLDTRSSVMIAYGLRSTNDNVAPVASTAVGGNKRRQVATVGYDHFLSKRTDVYAVLMHDRTSTNTLPDKLLGASATNFALGFRHRF